MAKKHLETPRPYWIFTLKFKKRNTKTKNMFLIYL